MNTKTEHEKIPSAGLPFRMWAGILAAFLFLSGCAVGPDFRRPSEEVPPAWIGASAKAPQENRVSSMTVSLSSWWKAFNDPVLTSLIERGIASNLDLKIASQRIRQSRAVLGQARGGLLPTLDASAGYLRSGTHAPDGEADQGSGSASGANSLYRAGLDASWEIDVFGGVRRGVEAAQADVDASVENLRDVLVILVGDIGINYMDLRSLQEQLRITRDNLTTQERSAEITRKRHDAGFASALDLSNALAQTSSTKAQIPALEARISQTIYGLGLLVGDVPGALVAELSPDRPIPAIPGQVPAGMPSQLLQRRPDIRSAEARLHAATARIGVSKADLFPRFFLSGSAGIQANDLDSWSSSVTRLWSLGPSVSWNLFSGGRTLARIEENRALAEQALLDYRKTILTALSEVEGSWVAFDKEAERQISLQVSVEQNRRAVELANRLYVEGQNDFLSVLVAERSLYAAQAELVRSRNQEATNLVSLYKALGGGWESVTVPGEPQE